MKKTNSEKKSSQIKSPRQFSASKIGFVKRLNVKQKLAQDQENFQEIFEKATVAIFVHDMETGRILAVNHKACEITGYSKEELTAAHPADISSGNPGFMKADAAHWIQKAITEGPQLFEWQGRHKNGNIHWIEVSLTRAKINKKDRLLAFFREIGDHKKTEDLTRLDQARAVESIKDYAILMLDKEGNVLTWNAGAERIKGYKASEIIGKNMSIFYTSEDKAKRHPEELLKRAAEKGRAEDEGWRIRKDGSRFMDNLVITALKDEKGEVRGFIKVTRDVTGLKKAERELREKTELLDSVLKNIGDGVVVADEKGKFVVFNPAAEKIIGLGAVDAPTDEWTGKYGVFLPDEVTTFLEKDLPLVKAINGEETNDMELFVKNANHPEGVSIHVTGRPIKDENGRNRGGVIIVRDITQRKKAEEEARRSQVFIASVLENLPNMVFVKDAKDLRFIMFNKAGEELLGYSRTDLIGKNDFDFFPKKEADFFTSKDRQVLAGRTLQDIPEETVQTRNKGERILHTRKIPLMDGAGAPEYLLGISEDITEQKRQEALRVYTKVLETSNRELQDFIFVASHDLQEPLRKIQTFGDFLKEETGASLSPTASDYLGRMQDAAHRMSILIEDLLQLTRITTQAKSFEPVNLSDILKEVLSDLDIRLKESGGRVEAYGLPRLIADPSQMRQLFQNLIANSLKFRKAGVSPLIEVKGEVDQRSDKCLIRVMDNGIGFDQKYADKIFNVFQRLHGSGEYEGTGIGLAICRKVVERHQGTITASSKPGEGAVFEIVLPLHQNQQGEKA